MKSIFNPIVLLFLALILLASASMCYSPPPAVPPLAPPPTSPPRDIISPDTVIIRAPDETISHNDVSFEWAGSDDTTSAADLTYSCFLEGYDTEYSPFATDTTKSYTDLPQGSYTFCVKSKDEAGNIDPTPATVSFTIVPTPKDGKPEVVLPPDSRLLVMPNSDVNSIAVGFDNTIYAVDSFNARLYRSRHGGYGWTDISRGIAGAATWLEVAVAPDNPMVVAVVTNSGREVYLSTNGGANFTASGLAGKLSAAERVTCLTISPHYGRHELAVGTSTASGSGRVLVSIIDSFPSGWQDMSSGASGWSPADVFAIEYSPGFAADGTILALVATGPPPGSDDTYLYIGLRDLAGNTTTWNSFSGYPVEVCQSGQETPGTPLTYADLALPADYLGTVPHRRHVYACWSDNPPGVAVAGNPNDDVYRLDDAICYRLLVRSDAICSIAHSGIFSRGKLLAGAAVVKMTGVFHGPQVYCTLNPQSTCPTWQKSLKPPTGPGQARVAWSADGRVAYCATSSPASGGHDQSAFSISTNNGLTWNQIGLIDVAVKGWLVGLLDDCHLNL